MEGLNWRIVDFGKSLRQVRWSPSRLLADNRQARRLRDPSIYCENASSAAKFQDPKQPGTLCVQNPAQSCKPALSYLSLLPNLTFSSTSCSGPETIKARFKKDPERVMEPDRPIKSCLPCGAKSNNGQISNTVACDVGKIVK